MVHVCCRFPPVRHSSSEKTQKPSYYENRGRAVTRAQPASNQGLSPVVWAGRATRIREVTNATVCFYCRLNSRSHGPHTGTFLNQCITQPCAAHPALWSQRNRLLRCRGHRLVCTFLVGLCLHNTIASASAPSRSPSKEKSF